MCSRINNKARRKIMIKNIIFDIGGVLLEYNPKTYLDKLNIEESKRKSKI